MSAKKIAMRCPNEKGKFCGYSCYRNKAHDLRDCRRRKHFDVKENYNEFTTSTSSWQRESSFKVPVVPNLDVQEKQGEEQQKERTWTAQEGKALKIAYDLVTNYEKDNQEIKD